MNQLPLPGQKVLVLERNRLMSGKLSPQNTLASTSMSSARKWREEAEGGTMAWETKNAAREKPGRRQKMEVEKSLLRHVPGDQLGHLEHADLGLAIEHGLQLVIGIDHGLHLLVLKTILLDVVPQFLGELGPGQRFAADNSGKNGVRSDRGHELSIRGAGGVSLP